MTRLMIVTEPWTDGSCNVFDSFTDIGDVRRIGRAMSERDGVDVSEKASMAGYSTQRRAAG
ncbi:MAG: hypothetical protein ACRDRN_02155 [Sciscionella sp.]